MRLVFDLYSLSDPEAWEHIVNITFGPGCIVAGVFALRKKLDGATAWRRFQRGLMSLSLFAIATPFVWSETRAIAHSDQRDIAKWIDERNYEVVSGPIAHLVLKEKFWKSDPNPTFVVGESSFEYGLYSKNRRLRNYLEGGPLREKRKVLVWHHDGLILRLYLKDREDN